MNRIRVALVGDFNPEILAHRAINQCIALAHESNLDSVTPEWVATDTIVPGRKEPLERFSGIWCTPGSPYRSTEAALWAIQYSRTHSIPFLGTCGGYQHALLEYARNVLGLIQAGHAELDSTVALPLINRMPCPLIEKSQPIHVTHDSFRALYGRTDGLEGFHCSYGLSPIHEKIFAGTPLEIVARSDDGEARAFQLQGHPFFIGTQFQPERKALIGPLHPLVRSFFAQCAVDKAVRSNSVSPYDPCQDHSSTL